MNLLSCYQNQVCWAREGRLRYLTQAQQKQQQIRKLIQTIKQRFQSQSITIITPQIYSRTPIKMPIQAIEFSLINDSIIPQYDYCFKVQINMNRNSLKITAIILKQGRMLNVYKEGLTQALGHYLQSSHAYITYSLRIDPFSGVIKIVHLIHMTRSQIQEMYKFPVNFCQNIKEVIDDMIGKFDGKLLGKILHAINQIPLKNILPQNFDCVAIDACQTKILKKIQSSHPLFEVQTLHHFWILNKRLKQIRRYIANSSIKYPFFSNDSVAQKIKFSKQLVPKNKKQLQKQQKIARHNVKILPFSKQVKDILSYYTPINRLIQQQYSYKSGGDNFWLQPTPEQIKNIYTCLDCQNMKKNGRTYIPMTIQNIQNQVFICAGGFAQISHVVVTKVTKNIETSQIVKNKQSLIKKKASKQKLFWQKKVIQHIGLFSCLFVNKYFKLEIDAESTNLSKKMFDDSLFMEFCHQKSLNNYIAKMKHVLSITSRVFWLYQVSIGLRFLRDLGVVHLDIKPQNLLMKIQPNGPNNAFQIIKLIDFGQAYSQYLLLNQKRNRGHTCPYASPQLVKHTQSKYTQKSDVFSLGVMILIIIFQLNTIDIKRLTSNVIYDSNIWYIKLYSICIQKCRYLGYQPFMQALLNLAYKCINPVVSSRPYLNWVSVILKNILYGFQELAKIRL